MAEISPGGCYFSDRDSLTLLNPPPPTPGTGGYGEPGGALGCVNIGVSKGSGQYVSGGDRLVYTVWSSLAGLTVTLTGQQVTPDCRVTPFTLVVKPDGAVTPAAFTLSLLEGMVTALAVSVSGATVVRGQTYVRASVGIFDAGAVKPYATLISDYVTSSFQPSFPPAALLEATSGPGYIRVLDTAVQNAQNNWYITMPATRVWRVLAAHWTVDASADVGNRLEQLEGANVDGTAWVATADAVLPASQSGYYRFGQNQNPTGTVATAIYGRLPQDVRLQGPSGGSIGTNQIGFSSGSDISTFSNATVEEWLNI
jgi:hypothetical protein